MEKIYIQKESGKRLDIDYSILSKMTFRDAMRFNEDSKWRLPTERELKSIYRKISKIEEVNNELTGKTFWALEEREDGYSRVCTFDSACSDFLSRLQPKGSEQNIILVKD